MRDTGHTLFLSIKAQRINGHEDQFADIAAAAAGHQLYKDMQHIAAQIKAFKSPVYIIFNHEPEASGVDREGHGAAVRRRLPQVRDRACGRRGVTNAKYVATFTGYGFIAQGRRQRQQLLPGRRVRRRASAADVYNWAACRTQPWTQHGQPRRGHLSLRAGAPEQAADDHGVRLGRGRRGGRRTRRVAARTRRRCSRSRGTRSSRRVLAVERHQHQPEVLVQLQHLGQLAGGVGAWGNDPAYLAAA